ncbi:MAG TPA: hypothetical protein VFA65_24540 [Bryobacteraceae bacterium]|nr:hypothetical protein [Bryobacteraceae bacterium]
MIGWIRRNDDGIVIAFCDVTFADPQILGEFSESGKVELVEAEHITLNRPLPDDSRVLHVLDPEGK